MSPAWTCQGEAARTAVVARPRSIAFLSADAHGDAAGAAGHRPRARAESGRANLRVRALRAAECGAAAGARCRRRARRRVRSRISSTSRRASLTATCRPQPAPTTIVRRSPHRRTARLAFRVPARDGLPPLSRYATLQMAGERRTVGYTRGEPRLQASLPALPDRAGLRRPVSRRPADVVLADIRAQVAAGRPAHHLRRSRLLQRAHARDAIVAGMPREFPGVTYDVTIKVEHLLQHRDHLPLLRDTGCAFVTSAVESVDDDVLAKLDKGHTRADFERSSSCAATRGSRSRRRSSPFTPWTTLASYRDLLRTIDALDLVDHVAPIQLADPAADSAGVAAARTARRARGHRAVRPGVADAILGASRPARGRAAAPTSPNSSAFGCRPSRQEVFARVWERVRA